MRRFYPSLNFRLLLVATGTFICTLSNSIVAYGQQVHAYIFCRTSPNKLNPETSSEFDKGVAVDYAHIHRFAQNVAVNLNFRYDEHPLLGNKFNAENVESTLSAGRNVIHQNDVVILYFSTHGYIQANSSHIFPSVDLRDGVVSSANIFKKLSAARPRTLLTLIDACSNFRQLEPRDSTYLMEPFIPNASTARAELSKLKTTNYLNLFSFCKQIIVCAGQPGNSTYTDHAGSYFTSSFLKAFAEEVKPAEGGYSWDHIIDQAVTYTLEKERPDTNKPQAYITSCDNHVLTPTIPHIIGRDTIYIGPGITAYWADLTPGLFSHPVYRVDLTIDLEEPIDSVYYYLEPGHPDSIVKYRPTDLVHELYSANLLASEKFEKATERGQNFVYEFKTDHDFTVTGHAFLATGKEYEQSIRLNFSGLRKIHEKKQRTFWTILGAIGGTLLIGTIVIVVLRRRRNGNKMSLPSSLDGSHDG